MPFNGSQWIPYEEFANGTLVDMGAYNSQISGYTFGVGILFLLYIGFLLAGVKMAEGSDRDALSVNAAVSFFIWIISILMVAMESSVYGVAWLPQEAAYATTFLMIVSISILYFGRR